MSTKFNRNDSNAADDQLYLDDYRNDLNGVEEDHRTGIADLHAVPAIISGLSVTLNANNTSVDVAAGVAYDKDAYRIEVASAELAIPVDTTLDAINYICIKHVYSYGSSRTAYKTGVLFNATKYDDFQIDVKTEAEGPPSTLEAAGYVVLATTTGTGSSVSISIDDRTKPDYSGEEDTSPPAQVINVSASTGPESSLVYNAAGNPIADQMVEDDLPARAWIRVSFSPVSDPSGISRYEIEMVPLDDSDAELPDYLESAQINYNYV
jgi:hypothetical protein